MGVDASKLEKAYIRGQVAGTQLMRHGTSTVAEPFRYWHDSARCLAAVIGWPTSIVVEKVRAYHLERLEAVPDLTTYPELRGYRDLLDAQERGIREAGVDEDTLALSQTLNFWRDTRLMEETGKAHFTMALPEKCRVLYAPETDRGAIHAKNVDDPLTYWRPRPALAPGSPWPHTHPLTFDSVGSGLHIDEVPPEIFPVNVADLALEHCGTVLEATEFHVRYNYFWASANRLIHDREGNSVALEKTRCRIAVRGPNEKGINFISGMGAHDSELSAYIQGQRQKYLAQQGWTWEDSADGCFFVSCENKWKNMARYVDELSLNPTFDNVKQLMEQRDPRGPMCLTGEKCHPDQTTPGCTLVMDMYLLDEKKLHRRQWRGNIPAYLDNPEVVQFL